MDPLNFDFHHYVGLQIETDDPWIRSYFLSEYGFAAGSTGSKHSMVRLVLRHSWLPAFPGRGFRLRVHKVFARWFYRVRIEEDNVLIEAVGNRAAVPMIQHMLVHPSLRYLCSRSGVLLLHGASISRSGRSLILTGHGGAGKTTTSALMLSSDDTEWAMQGDDYTFVGPDGETLAYATRAHLYRSILGYLPELADRLRPRERLHLTIFGLIRRVSGESIRWPLRMRLGQLWPDRRVEPKAALAGILMLRRVSEGDVVIEPSTDLSTMLDVLIQMNFHEARHYLRLVRLQMDADVFSRWRSAWAERERELLERLVGNAPVYWLNLPQNHDSDRASYRQLAAGLKMLLEPSSD